MATYDEEHPIASQKSYIRFTYSKGHFDTGILLPRKPDVGPAQKYGPKTGQNDSNRVGTDFVIGRDTNRLHSRS